MPITTVPPNQRRAPPTSPTPHMTLPLPSAAALGHILSTPPGSCLLETSRLVLHVSADKHALLLAMPLSNQPQQHRNNHRRPSTKHTPSHPAANAANQPPPSSSSPAPHPAVLTVSHTELLREEHRPHGPPFAVAATLPLPVGATIARLAAHLRANGPPKATVATTHAYRLLSAVAAMQNAGVGHGHDLTPDHILVDSSRGRASSDLVLYIIPNIIPSSHRNTGSDEFAATSRAVGHCLYVLYTGFVRRASANANDRPKDSPATKASGQPARNGPSSISTLPIVQSGTELAFPEHVDSDVRRVISMLMNGQPLTAVLEDNLFAHFHTTRQIPRPRSPFPLSRQPPSFHSIHSTPSVKLSPIHSGPSRQNKPVQNPNRKTTVSEHVSPNAPVPKAMVLAISGANSNDDHMSAVTDPSSNSPVSSCHSPSNSPSHETVAKLKEEETDNPVSTSIGKKPHTIAPSGLLRPINPADSITVQPLVTLVTTTKLKALSVPQVPVQSSAVSHDEPQPAHPAVSVQTGIPERSFRDERRPHNAARLMTPDAFRPVGVWRGRLADVAKLAEQELERDLPKSAPRERSMSSNSGTSNNGSSASSSSVPALFDTAVADPSDLDYARRKGLDPVYAALVARFRCARQGVRMAPHKAGFLRRVVRHCFSGAEATAWIAAFMRVDRVEAVHVGQHLADADIIRSADKVQSQPSVPSRFVDDPLSMYMFVDGPNMSSTKSSMSLVSVAGGEFKKNIPLRDRVTNSESAELAQNHAHVGGTAISTAERSSSSSLSSRPSSPGPRGLKL